MDVRDSTVLILGGAGLVGQAVARRLLSRRPGRLVVGSLLQSEAEEAAERLREEAQDAGIRIDPVWGDLFVPAGMTERSRDEILDDPEARSDLVEDLYGELTEEVFGRSTLGTLLLEVRPSIVVDCVNTAGALAYQDAFASATELRRRAEEGTATPEAVERLLATLYLPQLIRHAQVALEGMKRVGTRIYMKVGTSGTGGMGLNIPFTHSEERPSRVLLAKAGVAGAHTLLLYLMARTPGAPAVKEVKPTAAVSWKSIGHGVIRRRGRVVRRSDATGPLPLSEAFGAGAGRGWEELGEPLEGVYMDAGENGLFSLAEFEALTALGLMEFVTPEEIAENVLREILGHPTGRDVVAGLDATTMGPTYRAGVLRSAALNRMEELEAESGSRAVAYEMLGPPRLSKLLFEAELLRRLHSGLEEASDLDPHRTAAESRRLLEDDDDFRQRILTVGLPILLPDGDRILRGPEVRVPPLRGSREVEDRVVESGWVDLRPRSWRRWRERVRSVRQEILARPGLDRGSRGDYDYGDGTGQLRPGRLAAWIFRTEDEGARVKR